MSAEQLIEQLANSFGKPDEICSLLADDASWWISPPIADNIRGDSNLKELKGIDALQQMMNTVFGEIYDPASVVVTVHEAIGNESKAAARLTLTAKTTWGADYSNEYALFIHAQDGKIVRIYEYLDAVHAQNQLT